MSYGDDPLDVIVKEEICDEVPEVEVKINDKKVPTKSLIIQVDTMCMS